jgi:hypothetical protein
METNEHQLRATKIISHNHMDLCKTQQYIDHDTIITQRK